MKNLILLLLLGVQFANAQNASIFYEHLKSKDFQSISSQLDSDVTYCENDNQEFVDKATASKMLASFFKGKSISNIEDIHSGNSKNTNYRVSKISTSDGAYRLFLYFEDSKVTELRIDNY